MNPTDAVLALEQALNIAVQRGCFTMQDVQNILIAVAVVKENIKQPQVKPDIKTVK